MKLYYYTSQYSLCNMSSIYSIVSSDGSTIYVALTKKVFKYNHEIWYAKFVNGVPIAALYAEVDYTVDLEIDQYKMQIDELPLAIIDFNDGNTKVVGKTTILDASPENMFCIEFSGDVLNKHTTITMAPSGLGDGDI